MAAAFPYTKFIDSVASGLVDVHTDTFKAMLLTAYTVGTTQDDAQFVADVLAAPATQVTGAPYSAGGLALSSVTFTASGGVWTFDCADPTWGAGPISASYAVFYDSTPGSDATNPVVGFWDFGGSVTQDPFALTLNASGLFTFGRT